MLASHKALHPHYADKFQCIGAACEDTCCSSWQIPVDRQTFDKYRALPPGPLVPIFAEHLILRTHPAPPPAPPNTDSFFGQITLLPNGACPFLSTENLCRIQADLGKDHLSRVCATFPRTTRTIDSHPETSLQLSCPEAARQVLLDRRFMHLPHTAPRGYARYTPFLALASQLDPPHGNPLQYLLAIRHLHILILKDRSYPLWQRLFIIGLFAKRLTEILGQAAAEDRSEANATVPMLLQSYAELMQQSRLRSTMDVVPARPATQLSIILKLLDAPRWHRPHSTSSARLLSGVHGRHRLQPRAQTRGRRCLLLGGAHPVPPAAPRSTSHHARKLPARLYRTQSLPVRRRTWSRTPSQRRRSRSSP